MARPSLAAAWLLLGLLCAASGCEPFSGPGLKVDGLSADDGAGLVQLKLRWADEPTAFYPGPDSEECGQQAVFEYDLATGSLQPAAAFSAQQPDLGPALNPSLFAVMFRVGGAEAQTLLAPGEVFDFALPRLQSPSAARFWPANGRIYFYYPIVAGFELSICSLADRTCVVDASGALDSYAVMTSTISFPEWEPTVYEEANLVELNTLDSCFPRLLSFSGRTAVTQIEGLSDRTGLLFASTIVAGPSGRVGYYASTGDSDELSITRVDLATGEMTHWKLGVAEVRKQMLAPCVPVPPPSPPSSVIGDPHLRLAHGGRADFRGCDGCMFNFLSARDLSVNVKTEAATFGLNGGTVHGTFLTELHIVSYDRPADSFFQRLHARGRVGRAELELAHVVGHVRRQGISRWAKRGAAVRAGQTQDRRHFCCCRAARVACQLRRTPHLE
jgi:hypothetical protein